MRNSAVFGSSFLDGFTMAGFLHRLRRPHEATRLLAPPESVAFSSSRMFEIGAERDAHVVLAGDLHSVPEAALRQMLDVLMTEAENRKLAILHPAQTMHGAS